MKNSELAAFPIPKDRDYDQRHKNGLNKREYFAGMAMQGLLANPKTISDAAYTPGSEIANLSVSYADALLAELENNNHQNKQQ